jgi:hypothetical protein
MAKRKILTKKERSAKRREQWDRWQKIQRKQMKRLERMFGLEPPK